MKTIHACLIVGALLLLASAPTMVNAQDYDKGGYIYGKITSDNDETFTGWLRWGTQECFWDDLFNATKEENPWWKYIERDQDNERSYDRTRKHYSITVLGIKVNDFGLGDASHMFITRFGDMKSIEPRRDDRAIITMKNGSEYEVSGSGDIGESIQVIDASLGKINLEWDEIDKIDFLPTPPDVKVEGYRLKGKIITYEMEFNGFIMWDAEECLSTDVLDGEREGRTMHVEFANIRSLKRAGSSACEVTLKDGRNFELRGTNDVNSENRGIYVQDERFGKIEVQWDQFKEIIYEDSKDSGMPYSAYEPVRDLKGTVTTSEGKEVSGRLVFDTDEAETFELLNGNLDDMQFDIPFSSIASIEPVGYRSAKVKLFNGQDLRLEDGQDVSENNYGMLVFKEKGSKPEYIPWEDVEKVTFQR
jgi:hypothetical protein